jgi:hypothetical protein
MSGCKLSTYQLLKVLQLALQVAKHLLAALFPPKDEHCLAVSSLVVVVVAAVVSMEVDETVS